MVFAYSVYVDVEVETSEEVENRVELSLHLSKTSDKELLQHTQTKLSGEANVQAKLGAKHC